MEKKTLRFYTGLDVILLREVLAVSNKGKLAWEEIHSHVNDAIKAPHMSVTLRACKDRLRHLQDVHKRNEMSSLRASGTEEEYDERTQMLTELADLDEERKKEEGKPKCVKDEKEKQGEIIRAAAMTSLVPTKRAQNDEEKGLRVGHGTSKVFEVCPRLAPLNQQQTRWEGLILVKGKDLHLRIDLPEDGDHRKARLLGDWQLNQYLRGYHHLIGQRLQNTPDLATFLSELKNVLEHTMQHRGEVQRPQPGFTMATLCSQVIEDIGRLGWENLASIDASFRRLQLSTVDSAGKKHYITVHLDSQHPAVAPTCTVDLPGGNFEFSWTRQSTLMDIYKQFNDSLSKYREFWDTVAEIDDQTWVLEPDQPLPSDTMRRIALGNNSSVQVRVDPLYPKMLPEFRFLGADHVVNPMRDRLNANFQEWDTSRSLLGNLKALLDVQFPSPTSSSKEDFSEECGICYSYRLEGAIPDRACDNPQCNKPFHHSCLYEWLRSLPSSHQAISKYGFNTLFGECPYCSKPITVKPEGNR